MTIEIYRDDELQYAFTQYSGRIEIKKDVLYLMDVKVRIILESGVKIIIK